VTARPGIFSAVRRALLVVPVAAVLWAAPASAQTYGSVLRNSSTTSVSTPATSPPQTSGAGGGGTGLARTGSDRVVPMGRVAAVMVGVGTLLVLGTRRRRPPHPAD